MSRLVTNMLETYQLFGLRHYNLLWWRCLVVSWLLLPMRVDAVCLTVCLCVCL